MGTMFNYLANRFSHFNRSDLDKDWVDKIERPKLEEFINVHHLSENSKNEKISFKGTVTSMEGDNGVVNGDIYFSKDILLSVEYNVGMKVCGEAVRAASYDAWRALSLQIMEEDWDDTVSYPVSTEVIESKDENFNLPNVILGKVNAVYGALVCLNNGISFENDTCQFEIIAGDWLQCERAEVNDEKDANQRNGCLKMTKVEPLRCKTIHGIITKVHPSNYLINDEVFCDRGLFQTPIRLQTKVIVDIIESDQQRLSWRVIRGRIDPLNSRGVDKLELHSSKLTEILKVFENEQLSTKAVELTSSQIGVFLNQDNLLNNKQDINIRIDSDQIKMMKNYLHSLCFTINNSSLEYCQLLSNIWVYGYGSKIEMDVQYEIAEPLPISLKSNSQLVVMAHCKSKYEGRVRKLFIFNFGSFVIGKFLHFEISDRISMERPKKRYNLATLEGRVIRGEKPSHASPFIPVKLPHANLPNSLIEAVVERKDLIELIPCFDEPLNGSNYVEKFESLLYLEEVDMNLKMRQFSVPRCCFVRHGEFLALEVPGMSEGRPSLVVGDTIIASIPISEDFAEAPFLVQGMNEKENIRYEGCIHQVLHNKVLLRFHPSFHESYCDEDYAVSFHFSRTQFRRCHMAIAYARSQLGAAVFFPNKIMHQLPQVSYVDSDVSLKECSLLSKNSKKILLNGVLVDVHSSVNKKSNNVYMPLTESTKVENVNTLNNSSVTQVNKANAEFLESFIFKNENNTQVKSDRSTHLPIDEALKRLIPRSVEFKNYDSLGQPNSLNVRRSVQTINDSNPGEDCLKPLVQIRKLVKIKIPSHVKTDSRGYCIPRVNLKEKKVSTNVLSWFNSLLNPEQRAAVKRILEGSTRPLPYVVFGPPGTGKTVTMVEAILQIFTLVKHSRILVVGPSNSACDLLAERLITSGKLTTGSLVRINAYSRSVDTISELLEPYCNTVEKSYRHRLIVMTGASSGQLYTMEIKNGHFSHVFIDEAGHMTEPESCIALGLVNSASGQIVLAGDPHQLGPTVMSKSANKFGLAHSLLHRLCSSTLYQPRGIGEFYSNDKELSDEENEDFSDNQYLYEPRLVSLLTRNYRSHQDLIQTSSKLFYHSALIPCAKKEITHSMLDWPELPCSDCPLLFHPVVGQEQQEIDSPSWFNSKEAFNVARYTKSLLLYGVDGEDIGIITPYRKQVDKIRELLNTFQVEEDIRVGSVEEFQGQERKVIILSTVRSDENIEDVGSKQLGFLGCPRRFNVAITRARSLLIIVGNPSISVDPHWRQLLNYCREKNAIARIGI